MLMCAVSQFMSVKSSIAA